MEIGRLYQQILDDPDDDELRMSYADAVEPSAPEHAHLIREQVAHVRDRRAHRDWEPDRTVRMHDLEQRLRERVLPAGAAELVPGGYRLGRGLVETVTVPGDAFVALAGRMAAAFPLRMAHLTAVPPDLATLAQAPGLARLRGLSLARNPIGDSGLRTLLRSRYLGRLRWLDLTRTGVTAEGIEALAGADTTPDLRYVLADPELRLNPDPSFDWDGTLVYLTPATLAERLGARHQAPWLHRGTDDIGGYPGLGPSYEEV